ncbi:hypothetical protein BsWGS_16044 [Bradybaena similaris]
MSSRKKAWKLQDFVAHAADVRCLGLGHRSGRVMVTGGDDNKVNLWSVGKPHSIMSLTGHTSSVESVRFGPDEEMVVAGSLSGVLKVWDLDQAKILRTLTGHKAGITSLDFNPYGNYVASGSVDCTVKLWDVRRKGCIYTYQKHEQGVKCLRFTPDAHWIASASEDNTVKIWDLKAGKLLADLTLHKGPVNTVEFHPSDLLLASGSSDKTVKFWELESFECTSSSDQDKQPVSILFHPDGSCLFSACGDTLKVYGWEPFICHDVIPVQWPNIADIAVANSQLIAASFSKTSVSTYVVDLNKVAPIGVASRSEHVRETLQSSSGRRSFILDPQTSSRQASEPKRADTPTDKSDRIEDDNSVSQADIQNQDDYLRFFKENARNPHTRDRAEPFQAPPEDDEAVKASNFQPAPVRKEISPPSAKPSLSLQKVDKASIQAEDFLPKHKAVDELSEKDVVDVLGTGHTTMITVLEQRTRNLQLVLTMWRTGSTKTALDSAISLKDPAVMVDILNIINTKPSLWDLDLCKLLLPQLRDLMGSKYESHFVTASNSLKLILRNFGDVIKVNIEEPPSSYVDITREERHKKCLDCFNVINSIKAMIRSAQPMATAKQASIFKEIMLLMARLD